jgi:Uma2 family endonuclease
MLEPMPDPDLLEPAAIAPDRIRPLCFDEYMQLAESGAFDDQKVELLGGVVVTMNAQGEQHVHLITLLTRLLARRLPDDYMVVPQSTYKLSRYSAPEPDFAIVTSRSVWAKGYPSGGWLIEVSVTSQHKDRGLKAQLYAAANIAEYWVIDATTRTVDVHLDPSPDGYRSIARHDEFAQLASQAIPSLVFSIDALLHDRVKL